MIASFLRWSRRTLPPAWAIVPALGFILFVEGLYLWVRWCISVPEIAEITAQVLLRGRDGFVAAVMALYGIFRVMAFHPLFRPRYRDWLEQTPWTVNKPLPLGPIHLIWQDVILVGLAMLSLHDSTQGRPWPLLAFFFAYLGVLGVSFWRTGPWWMGYLVLFGLAGAARTIAQPFLAIGILVGVYLIALFGVRASLRLFPWPRLQFLDEIVRMFRNQTPARERPIAIAVWPLTQPQETWKTEKINRRDGILAPLLGACWLYALASHIQKIDDQSGFLGFVLFFTTAIALILRLTAYVAPCWPPIGFWGRIFTRHWVIPGYDHVFLAPLCTLITALAGWFLAMLVGPPYYTIMYPLVAAWVAIVALNMGPSLRKWQLTGQYRMAVWDSNTKSTDRIKL